MGKVLLIVGIIIAIIVITLLFYSLFVTAHKADEEMKKANSKKKTDKENKEKTD